jgi:hypothetical protein
MKTLKIISERVMKAGYVLRRELSESPRKGEPPFEWTRAYTPRGEWIGNPKTAYHLCVTRGIQPELRTPDSQVCSIGFSVKDGKWYGWSHRAIFGFKIGSKCLKGHCHYSPRGHGGRGEWTAKTVADARQMACDFAEGVS